MSDTKTGGCLCGAVRYEYSGEPLFAGNCYCTDCQKFSGSGHLAIMGLPENAVSIEGEVSSYTMTGDSGQPITRYFCKTCGSPVGASIAGGLRTVYAGTLDDPAAFKPGHSIYTGRAQDWDKPDAAIRGFEGGPPAG